MNLPNPETLEGEELNYWAGIAAGKEPFFHEGKYYLNTPNNQLGWRWNPIQDANQCLEISEGCWVFTKDKEWSARMRGQSGHYYFGHTELIARCRAVVAKWVAEQSKLSE